MRRLCVFWVICAVTWMLLLPNISLAIEIKGGPKIGLNLSDVYLSEGGETFETDSRIGLCVGGFIVVNLTRQFAIQPEIYYTKKGAKYEGTYYGEHYTSWLNLTYLEIPILAKLILPTQSDFNPFIFVGPAISIKLSGKIKEESNGSTYEEDVEDLKGEDFGLIFGAGFDFGKTIAVDIRYNLGLSKVIDDEYEGLYAKNRTFSITIGYSFNWPI